MLAEKAGEAEAAEHGVEPCPLARRSDGEPPVSLPIEERFQAVDRRHLSRVRFDGSIDKRAELLTIERAAEIQLYAAMAIAPAQAGIARHRLFTADPAAKPCQHLGHGGIGEPFAIDDDSVERSEEHTSELQSLMRISYAV